MQGQSKRRGQQSGTSCTLLLRESVSGLDTALGQVALKMGEDEECWPCQFAVVGCERKGVCAVGKCSSRDAVAQTTQYAMAPITMQKLCTASGIF